MWTIIVIIYFFCKYYLLTNNLINEAFIIKKFLKVIINDYRVIFKQYSFKNYVLYYKKEQSLDIKKELMETPNNKWMQREFSLTLELNPSRTVFSTLVILYSMYFTNNFVSQVHTYEYVTLINLVFKTILKKSIHIL